MFANVLRFHRKSAPEKPRTVKAETGKNDTICVEADTEKWFEPKIAADQFKKECSNLCEIGNLTSHILWYKEVCEGDDGLDHLQKILYKDNNGLPRKDLGCGKAGHTHLEWENGELKF